MIQRKTLTQRQETQSGKQTERFYFDSQRTPA
jgi:hypothetical protein